MKRIYIIITIAIALVIGLAGCTSDKLSAEGNGSSGGANIVNTPENAQNGQILIKFRAEISDLLDQTQTRSGVNSAMTRSGVSTVDELMDIIGGYKIERVFPVDSRHEERTREAGLHLWYTVYFDEDVDVQDVAKQLSQLGELSKIEYSRELKRSKVPTPRPITTEQLQALAQAQAVRTRGAAISSLPFTADPMTELQWHYVNEAEDGAFTMANMIAGADVNCAEAWELCTGDPSIIVAVMDEGVMWSHPDLAANIWVNPNEEYKSDTDNDGNGYKGDVYGYNFVHDTGIITWDDLNDTGHGTHIAGTIAAVNGNGVGVSGIAGGVSGVSEGVKIMSLQIFAGASGVTTTNEVRAMKYAADNGAVILQCSWGYNSYLANPLYYTPGTVYDDDDYAAQMPLEKEAIDYFIYNAGDPNGVIDGGLVVFAAGNEYAAMAAYPAAYGKALGVASMAADYTPASYTNYGPGVDITAPGGDTDYHMDEHGGVLSTLIPLVSGGVNDNTQWYGYMDGTSMACPHVSGVAALGLSYAAKLHKRFNSREYRELILSTTRDIDSRLTSGTKDYYVNWSYIGDVVKTQVNLSNFKGKMGRGVVDAGALLRAIGSDEAGTPMTLPNVYVSASGTKTLNVTRYYDNGESTTFTATSANPSIAAVEVSGKLVIVTGVAVGTTTFTVTSATGVSQTATITVRNTANGNGWL